MLLFGVAPALLSDFRLNLLAKFCCLAMVAVGIGLAWGRGGMLVLGQGVFFGLGGYLMAMHLKLSDAGPGGVPDFMLLYGDGTVPGWWEPFRDPVVTILAILVLPALVATLLGLAVFKRRVRGAYFAILSQALAAAFAILLVGQQKVTGGTNGLNGFRSFFGFTLSDPVNKRMLYFIAAGVLLAMVAIVRLVMNSRYGELLVAVRDQENRVRFLGYDPAIVKTVAYAIAACFAAIGGALFTPIVGIISPGRRRRRALHRVPGRRRDRRAGHPARAGARRDRGVVGGDVAVGVVPVVLDLLPGRAVHPRRRVPAQRARDDRPAVPPPDDGAGACARSPSRAALEPSGTPS